jgi:hypothetical protein
MATVGGALSTIRQRSANLGSADLTDANLTDVIGCGGGSPAAWHPAQL